MPIFDHRRPDCYSLKTEALHHKYYFDCPEYDASQPFQFSDKLIPRETVFYETIYSIAFTNIRCVVPGRILFHYFNIAFNSKNSKYIPYHYFN